MKIKETAIIAAKEAGKILIDYFGNVTNHPRGVLGNSTGGQAKD